MSKRFSREFGDDVVGVAPSGRFTHEEVAYDFDISLSGSTLRACVSNSANANKLVTYGKKLDSRRFPCLWCDWT